MTFEPIGFVRSPYKEKRDAPRQGVVSGAEGTIELLPKSGFLHALEDLDGFERIVVIFYFHEVEGWRPKVQPPRSSVRRGVFATRSPHRPNPIGFSVVKLLRVDGLVLHVAELDMLDGTPVLDVKPYVSYTDSIEGASRGWLEADPIAPWEVDFSEEAERALAVLAAHGVSLRETITASLALGPEPHAYRRIRPDGATSVLAIKAFRARFVREGERRLRVLALFSGYSPRQIAERDDPDMSAHRALLAISS